mgnify:CR=1 FL=1
MNKIAIAALLTAFVAAPAVAADSYGNAYVGIKVGQAKTNFDNISLTKDSPMAYGIFGGSQFNKNFAVEAEYTDLGKGEFAGGEAKSSAWGLSVVGSVPIGNNFSLYGKLGVARANTDASGSASAKHTGATYGLGGNFDVSPSVGLRLSYERYNLGDSAATFPSGKADVLALGAVLKF